jgi:hypothetical protein
MTTPSPFLAWHAEAMRYAEMMADASWANAVAFDDHECEATAHKVAAARAALSAHLLAVPMGEPVAWMRQHDGAQTSAAQRVHATEAGANDVARMFRDDGYQCLVLPLFTKPEGMA